MLNLFLVYFVNFYIFRAYLCPSSGGTTYVYNNLYLLFFLDDSLLSWLDWNNTVRTIDSTISSMFFIPNHSCIRVYNRLPEKEPSVSKHVEDIKIEDQIINL